MRRLGFEARQGVDVGLDLAGRTEEVALWPGEQRHGCLWHGVDAFLADHRQCQRSATGHGVVPTGFLAQRQEQFAGLAQGELGGGLHFQDARVGTQQQVVVDQLAETLLVAEQAQQHLFDAAHALLESAVGGDQLNHRLDVFVPGGQHLGVTLAQGNLPVAGLGPVGHADQRLFVVGQLLQYIAHAHIEQA